VSLNSGCQFVTLWLWDCANLEVPDLPLKMETIGSPQKSVNNYQYSQRNSPEELSSHNAA